MDHLPGPDSISSVEHIGMKQQTPCALAFCMSGDPDIHDQKQRIARIPLSGYVLDSSQASVARKTDDWIVGGRELHSGSDIGHDPTTDLFTGLHHHAAALLKWQEQQTVLLNIDIRFRFRCIVSWLNASSPSQLKRITSQGATFVQQHVRDQHKLLKAEAESLKQLLTDRQEEGRSPTKQQMQQVKVLDEDMQRVAEASKMVRELVELAVGLEMVEGEVKLSEAISLAPAGLPAAGKDVTLADGALTATKTGAPNAIMDLSSWVVPTSG
ncbi:hypothetical protein LTR17_010024 [Elasticomyces elasticus]|nr:hypothetical protein LTR17_010024 [Elasticomyces elasticus]